MAKGDVTTIGAILFKFSVLVITLLLGFQLISDQLPFPYDIMTLFSWEQVAFLFVTVFVALLAFIEGLQLQRRSGGFNFGTLVLYIVAIVGAYFSVLIIVFNYNFDDSTMNTYLGYYLLVGVVLILINSKEQLSKLRKGV